MRILLIALLALTLVGCAHSGVSLSKAITTYKPDGTPNKTVETTIKTNATVAGTSKIDSALQRGKMVYGENFDEINSDTQGLSTDMTAMITLFTKLLEAIQAGAFANKPPAVTPTPAPSVTPVPIPIPKGYTLLPDYLMQEGLKIQKPITYNPDGSVAIE